VTIHSRPILIHASGVVLYELGKMRAQNFTDRFLASVTATFAEQDQRRAQWGDQEFLNNFARYQPQSVSVLHCGCNYQWMGFRKEAKCGMQPVTIAHGWWVLAWCYFVPADFALGDTVSSG
jgi:hypothetical protein